MEFVRWVPLLWIDRFLSCFGCFEKRPFNAVLVSAPVFPVEISLSLSRHQSQFSFQSVLHVALDVPRFPFSPEPYMTQFRPYMGSTAKIPAALRGFFKEDQHPCDTQGTQQHTHISGRVWVCI